MTIRPVYLSNAANDTTPQARRNAHTQRAAVRWHHAFDLCYILWQVISFSSVLACLAVLTACERRPLEEYDYEKARVRIDMDWESYFTEVPTGMTVMIFDSEGYQPATTLTNNIRSHTVSLGEGTYRLLVFNQSFDEFGSMRFFQTHLHDSLNVQATNIMTRQNTVWDEGVRYMRDPEAIGAAVDTFTITKEMLTEGRSFREHPRTRSTATLGDDGVWVLPETVYPLISSLHIRVHIIGMQNMSDVIGSIDGMASGCYFSSALRNTETGTLLLDNWKRGETTGSNDTEGWIVTSIPTFGLPHGKERVENRVPEDNIIRLHFTLRDGSTRDFKFNVSHAIKYREDTVHLIARAQVQIDLELVIEAPLFDDIVLPDVEPSGSGGGFDAHVDPWDDGGTIDIGF